MKCPKCQHENEQGDKFCRECGAKLPSVCPNCGHELDAQDKFCAKCGTKLVEAEPIAPPRLEDMQKQLQDRIPQSLADKLFAGARQMQGEYRLVTALFADVSGSSGMARELPLEQYVETMNECFKMMVDTISIKYEGSINRFIGDCVLAFFGAPITHENDAERAILAALDIREGAKELGLEVSIGINTGMTYVGEMGSDLTYSERSAWGPDVDFARRLQEAAGPGQIWVGAPTYRLTRRAFDFGKTVEIEAKGAKGTAYPVLHVKEHPEKLRGIEGLRARMIGREREFSDLKEAADGLISGRGSIVTIVGEAGLGKSRLAYELKEYLKGKDIQWYEGRSISIGQTVSYWPFLDILRTYLDLRDTDTEAEIARKLREAITDLFPKGWEDVLPFMGRLLSVNLGDDMERKLSYYTPEQIRHQTLMRMRGVLTAISRRKPLLLILEDMHWSDDLSMDLVSLLMDDLAENPLMLLCIYRPERGHRCWQLGDIASRKCLERYTEITLKKLSSAQSRQLVESLLEIENLPEATRDMILRKSEGNPFFIEEVIRSLIDRDLIYREADRWKARRGIEDIDVPDTIQSVLLSRVDRLEAETRYVLQCASVIGRLFRYRLLEHLSRHERDLEEHLSELEGRELIYEERTVPELEYAFKHVLTQEATYQGILERRRMEFHRRVADGIESLYGDQLEKFYEELAQHYKLGGDDEKAIDYLLKAGVKAADQYSNQTALRYLDQAGELLDKSSEPHRKEKASLYEKRAEVLQRIGQWTKAIKEYEEALKCCDDKHNRAEIYCRMGWLECEEMQDKIRGITHFELGLKELPENDNSIERVRLESNMVWSTDWWKMDAFEEKITRCLWLSEIAEKMGYKQELAILYAYIAHWQTYMGKNPDEYRQRALTIAEELGSLPKIAWVYYVIAMTFKKNQIYLTDHGIPYCLRSLQISEHIGDIQTVAMVLLELGKVYKELNWDEKAIESLERVLDISSETKSIFPIVVASGVMELYGKRGQEDIVISTFLRIMRILTTLDIDEESQARVLLCGRQLDVRMDWIYMNFRNCYNLIGREREFPGIAQKVLMELLKDANSRPQKAWYYKQLMYICQELDDIFSAETYAKEFVLIVERMGKPDYMAEFYHAYLVAGEVDKATDLAYKYLSSRVHRFKTFDPYYWFIITRYYKQYGYTDHLRKLSKQVQETMSNILEGIALFLEPVETVNPNQPEFVEQFMDELIEDGWEWTDPAEDCSYRLLKPGIEIHVLPGHNDISRLLRNIESDFIIESCLLSNSTGGRFGGLFVWEDANNFIGLRSSNITDESVCMFAYLAGDPKTVGYHDFKAEKVWLRIERKGECFTGYVSFDGNIWYRCGWMNMALENLIKVGIGAWNPWTSESSYSRLASFTTFEYFKIYRPQHFGELK